jgi:hypothetical protein
MNSNNDSEMSDNFSDFPAEQIATPVTEFGITESQDSTFIPNEDNTGNLKIIFRIYLRH